MNISYPGSQSVNAHFGQFKYFCKVLKTDFETFFKYRVGTRVMQLLRTCENYLI